MHVSIYAQGSSPTYVCITHDNRLGPLLGPHRSTPMDDQILASGQTAMSEQERCSWVSYVLYDPARPRFCSTAEAVWGDLYSARKFGKFGLSLVPT